MGQFRQDFYQQHLAAITEVLIAFLKDENKFSNELHNFSDILKADSQNDFGCHSAVFPQKWLRMVDADG